MTNQVDVLRIREYFQDGMISLAQQREAKLLGVAERKMIKGKMASFNRIHKRSLTETASRLPSTPFNEQQYSRRSVILKRYIDGDAIDRRDLLESGIDALNPVMAEMVNAYNRLVDLTIINAALGTALTGEDGAGTQALPSGQKVTTTGGLTSAKIREALAILGNADVPLDDLFLIVNQEAFNDLLAINEFVSLDYVNNTPNVSGMVGNIYGAKVIKTQMINSADDGAVSSDRPAILMTSNAIKLAVGIDPIYLAEPDINSLGNMKIAFDTMLGAVRVEDEQVVRIKVVE